MLGIVVDRAESWLDPAAINDALTQGRRIKVTPGLEPLHDPNRDQDDRGCKQKQKRDHAMHSENGAAAPYPSPATRPSRRVLREPHGRAASDKRVPPAWDTWAGAPAKRLRIDFGCTRCTNAA
jgi:hypothetical protein